MKLDFPWSAVLGQERLKLALLLCAIDPGIGGVLVRGPRGVAKTTLARAFAELLPGRFVELPLGATEERVTGTLDLGKALQRGQVEFSPGLLARAHQGVLYVDEVNLLPDALVDLLLDAAASGTNVVERDGISHSHPARFVLVGTMNPEEGELRPQFVDRFGLSVAAQGELSPHERLQIVQRRLEFERAPERFVASFEAEQRALRERCAQARERCSELGFAGPGLERVADVCHAARVEGVRADLAMLRAARAHAVWHGRDAIELLDVEAVAELALTHRRREPPDRSPPSARGGAGSGNSGASAGNTGASSGGSSAPSGGMSGVSGVLPPVPVRSVSVALPADLPALADRRSLARRKPLPVGTRGARRRGPALARGSVDWFGTLLRCPRPTHTDLRRRLRPARSAGLWILVLDCSSSMLQSGALAIAKGVAEALAVGAQQLDVAVAMVSFQGDRAHTWLGTGRGALGRTIAELGAGGGTPLRLGLRAALAVCRRPAYQGDEVQKRLLLLTDGRTRENVTDLQGVFRGLQPCVVDCERGAVRLGRARGLASALGAGYVHVEQFT